MLTALPPAVVMLAVAIMLPLFGRRLGHAIAGITTGATLLWVLWLPDGTHLTSTFVTFEVMLLHVDPASRLLGATFAFIATATVLYAYASGRPVYEVAIATAYAGTGLGVAFAGDWLTLLIFVELMSVGSLLLIWGSGGPAVRAGFRYGVFHGISGLLLLLAVALQYEAVGSFLFSANEGIVAGAPAAIAAVAIGINAGFVALHTWLPDSYPKTHFVVSVVMAAYTTKAAVYTLFRAFPDGNLLVAYMGGAMAIFGVTMALLQRDMRRLLTYHIQSQVGYMVAGIGVGAALGISGGFFHLVNNVLYKSLLFMVAGVIIYRTGKGDLKKLGGLATVMPITFVVFLIAAFSIVGVPGFNGYVSKAMVKTAVEKEHLTALKWLLTVAGVGTAMSFAKFGYYAFFHGHNSGDEQQKSDQPADNGHGSGVDANLGQSVAMGLIAVACLLYGLFPETIYGLLPGIGAAEQNPYAIGKITEGVAVTVIGIVAFFAVRGPMSRIKRVPDVDALYNPMSFYGLRGVMRGSAVLAGTLDRAGARGMATTTSTVTRRYFVREWAEKALPVDSRTTRADLTLSLVVVLLLVIGLFLLL